MWVVAYLKFIIIFLRIFWIFFKHYFVQLFSADPKIFPKKTFNFFLPTKSWKNHPQKLLRKTQIHFFFPYCPELPKQPKQKNSCSKLWLIDQLYIELGPTSKQLIKIFFNAEINQNTNFGPNCQVLNNYLCITFYNKNILHENTNHFWKDLHFQIIGK